MLRTNSADLYFEYLAGLVIGNGTDDSIVAPYENVHIQNQILFVNVLLGSYAMSVQSRQQFPFASVPHVHTSVQTRRDQHHFIRMPFHSHNAAVVLQFLSNPIRCIVVNNHRGIHRGRGNPAIHWIERHST